MLYCNSTSICRLKIFQPRMRLLVKLSSASGLDNSNGDSPSKTSECATDYCVLWKLCSADHQTFCSHNLARIGQSPINTVTEMRSSLLGGDAEVSLPSHLTDDYTLLVEDYFAWVCRIVSGFDSPTNPLRT